MSDFDRNVAARGGFADRAAAVDAGLRAYMLRVYNYMAAAVALTGVVACSPSSRRRHRRRRQDHGADAVRPDVFSGPLMIVLLLGTLGLVFFISFRINRLQYTTALTLFMVYAALLGVTLSSIFLVYTGASITRVFFISAASFGALSLYGYTTQRDLSAMGSFLIMGLFGIIIASLVNIFLKSSGLDWAISVIGVGVFAGLTAWDTQRIKEMYDSMDDDGTVGPQGRDGRAVALSRLHQPVPDAAAPGRRPALSRSATESDRRPGLSPGRFLLANRWNNAAMSAVSIRPATPADIPAITRIYAARREARHGVVRARAAGRSRDGAPAARAARRRLSLSRRGDRRRAGGLCLCGPLPAAAGLSLQRRGFDLCRSQMRSAAASGACCWNA